MTRSNFLKEAEDAFYMPSGITWKRQPSIICAHTTEGSGFPGAGVYRQGRSAPHITTHPRARRTQQHFPFSRGAYALQAPSGIATNSMGVIQVEIVGTCEDRLRSAAHSVYSFDSGARQYLADIFGAISEATGIPLTSSVRWLPYPQSYGARNGVRLSVGEFYGYTGVLGHQHVPGNTHGDPGTFLPGILDLARGSTPSKESTLKRLEDIDMFVAGAEGRGFALFAPGNYKPLDGQQVADLNDAGVKNLGMVSAEKFDRYRDIMLTGDVSEEIGEEVLSAFMPADEEYGVPNASFRDTVRSIYRELIQARK